MGQQALFDPVMIKKWGNCEPKSGCFRGHFPRHFFDSMTAFVNGFSFEGDVLICQDLTKPNPVYLVLLSCRCCFKWMNSRTLEQAAFSKKIWQITAGCMFMQKLERTFAMKTQRLAPKPALRGGVGKSQKFGRFQGLSILYAVLKVYAPGLQKYSEDTWKVPKDNE